MHPTPIVLASTSPRRIELMRQAGFNPEIISPSTDESPRRGESPRELVTRLAREKAGSALPQALEQHGSVIIVAADTIVVAPNGKQILGKPRDRADACRMLGLLAGKTHTVLTGYAILHASRLLPVRKKIRVITSRVTMRELSKADIVAYVATGEPMDKAGSYAAQGIGQSMIARLHGSYTNVVGLPMAQLLTDLEESFGVGWLGARIEKGPTKGKA